MTLIIDGHNLIGAIPGIDLQDPDDEAQLLARLRAFRSHSGQTMIVFFDSGRDEQPWNIEQRRRASREHHGGSGLQVRYAAFGQTADDAIVQFLQSRAQPGQYAVVTNDAGLASRVRLTGASVQRASEFIGRLLTPTHSLSAARAAESDPDPRSPHFADLYAAFLAAERSGQRVDKKAPHEGIETWLERLYSDDVQVVQKAALWLGAYGGARALPALRDALTHHEVRVRAAALLALGDLADRAALPELLDHLEHDAASMAREAAAQSLGLIGDHRTIAALERVARTDQKSKVRKAALAALEQIRARGSAKKPDHK